MRKTLTDRAVAALKPRAGRYALPDPSLVGHYVRVQPSGAKTFVTVTRDRARRQIWNTIGATDTLTIEEARDKARDIIKRIRAGSSAPSTADSFESVAADWLRRYVQEKGLRSEHEIRRLLKAHVHPRWDGRAFTDIRRADVTALLDEIEDDHSARQADYVLSVVGKMMRWYATRHNNYVPPIVPGMKRGKPIKETARERVLDDGELRAVWKAAERNGTYGALVRLALLTAQRRDKLVSMRWADIEGDTWTIATDPREKGNAGKLVLPKIALDIIRAQPHLGNNTFVFAASRGDGHLRGYSKLKRAFDSQLPDMPRWRLHDLRRTARTLMGRAGVTSEDAERVMGHALGDVEATYDRNEYVPEKRAALAALAKLIAAIVNRSDNARPKGKRR